ncbi:MAG: asparagine synthetase B [Cyclobacteriaceae bacterium]|nr:MAG: asparagine synthetase B [Cyclobacteriaceae bacterium]
MKFRGLIVFIFLAQLSYANSILVPMDESQRDHLKAYGLAFHTLSIGQPVDWLLNYRGGSFLIPFHHEVLTECKVRGISYEVVSSAKANSILIEIARPDVNLNVVRLETAPRVAVYSPKNELINDETDAVILVLDYAEIPYTIIYDEEILKDELAKFDWLHLHHEDFTGQHGRFMRRESAIIQAKIQEETATRLGFASVTDMKLAVAKRIKGFTAGGGYLFAMCSGAETFDIALAAEGSGISFKDFSGDDDASLDYSKTLAFENFTLEPATNRKFSDINSSGFDSFQSGSSYFQLFQFSAKWDIVPSLLTQNHEHVIKEFNGQTSSFNSTLVKPNAWVLGENRDAGRTRYLYGELGRGHWTYYRGNDPERMPGWRSANTDLSMHPHSPGYRLILNNVLFPSAKKKKQKT